MLLKQKHGVISGSGNKALGLRKTQHRNPHSPHSQDTQNIPTSVMGWLKNICFQQRYWQGQLCWPWLWMGMKKSLENSRILGLNCITCTVTEANRKNLECLSVKRTSGLLSEAKENPYRERYSQPRPSGFPQINISQA